MKEENTYWCMRCKRNRPRSAFALGDNFCNKCKNTPLRNMRLRHKEYLVNLMGGRCSVCGQQPMSLSGYIFHHVNPATKSFSLSGLYTRKDFFEIMEEQENKKEIAKCILVCITCHTMIHSGDVNLNEPLYKFAVS